MRIATWNVNSIRSRVARVVDWLVREDVDTLAMQEIKCTPAQFPYEPFAEAGYDIELNGLNQWNGVAFASRLPMTDATPHFENMPGFLKGSTGTDLPLEARALGVTAGGVRLWSLYVPNGRALGDPHYLYKLDWLARLAEAASGWLSSDPAMPLALMGDWNIAPLDTDVWPTWDFVNNTHTSAAERAAFAAIERAGLTDVVRPLVPAVSPTGTTSNCASRATRACASTSSSARSRSPTSSRRRASTATSARATPPATTCRWSSTSTSRPRTTTTAR